MPYDHQTQAIKGLDNRLKKTNKALVVLPSGSGKTHTIAFHVAKIKPKSFLYVVHRNEILFQSIGIFKQVCGWDDSQIGILNTDFKGFDKPYIFATVQTLTHKGNLEKLSHDIDYVVVDEYHHSAAETYQRLLHYFRNVKTFVGLTATPFRLDQQDIMSYVGDEFAHNIDVFDGIAQKILVPFHYIGLYDDIDYSKIKFSGYTYKITDLDRKLVIHKRDEAVIAEYKLNILPDNRLSIGFCNSISHVNRITSKFRAAGINAAGITWHENYKDRQETIKAFKQGIYKVLFTRDILNEGVDFPECSALMFLRPTVSKTLFFQQLGRGLRKHPGKEDVIVLDFIGNYVRAFEKDKWFFKASRSIYTGRFFKPDYEYNYPKPVVEFDSNVLKIMELQKRFKQGAISKQEVYEDYTNCCILEKKEFLTGQEYRKSKYRTLGIQHMHNLFGEFRFFVQEFNITPSGYMEKKYDNPHIGFHRCADKDKLKENYYKIKKIWNDADAKWKSNYIKGNGGGLAIGVPPAKVMDDYHISSYASINYSKEWGNYRTFLNSIGELKRETLITPDIAMKRNSSREERKEKIRIAIKRLQEKIGRQYFTQTQWREHMGGYAEKEIRTEYNDFGTFRKSFGVPDGIPITCEICNKETLMTRGNDTKTCGPFCYRRWVKKNRTDVKWDEKLDKLRKEKMNCKFCGKEGPKYTIFNGAKRRNKGATKKTFCSTNCQNKFNYYQRVGRTRPLSTEERSKIVSEHMKLRWAKYSDEQKNHIMSVLRKNFVEKYPNHTVPITKKTREKMKEVAKRLYETRHVVNGRFAKKGETPEEVRRKASEGAKRAVVNRKRNNGKLV